MKWESSPSFFLFFLKKKIVNSKFLGTISIRAIDNGLLALAQGSVLVLATMELLTGSELLHQGLLQPQVLLVAHLPQISNGSGYEAQEEITVDEILGDPWFKKRYKKVNFYELMPSFSSIFNICVCFNAHMKQIALSFSKIGEKENKD